MNQYLNFLFSSYVNRFGINIQKSFIVVINSYSQAIHLSIAEVIELRHPNVFEKEVQNSNS